MHHNTGPKARLPARRRVRRGRTARPAPPGRPPSGRRGVARLSARTASLRSGTFSSVLRSASVPSLRA